MLDQIKRSNTKCNCQLHEEKINNWKYFRNYFQLPVFHENSLSRLSVYGIFTFIFTLSRSICHKKDHL